MTYILQNASVTLHVDRPTEHYQLSRFDWTGKIVKLIYKGVSMTSQELPDRNVIDQGLGFYNEFGINQPIGFDEVDEGDWFHKIGIGLLQKQGSVYDFQKDYNIRPAHFQAYHQTDQLTLSCQSIPYNGYGYLLNKRISLATDGFLITYELINTGVKVIRTNEYVHNFVAFNQSPIDEEYTLQLPFRTKPESFAENVNPERLVEFSGKDIRFSGIPNKPFFFSDLSGGENKMARWTLVNKRQKISLSETGSFTTEAINLWGWGHVISPELFVQIDLAPDESLSWSRSYLVENC